MKCATCLIRDVVGYLLINKDDNVYFMLCPDCINMYEGIPFIWDAPDEGA